MAWATRVTLCVVSPAFSQFCSMVSPLFSGVSDSLFFLVAYCFLRRVVSLLLPFLQVSRDEAFGLKVEASEAHE
ncbi:hypothetical protein TRSC58_07366 [Trypanosoma rangeli SC58]|uniref:Uncharacterized protein n=1 Tax=Trypanosoma rangeli SC58 TaxID=429131 RepID=A0A061ITE3_TRYRA|nr:hypothetical protein TRSC58_07366 [Trypanosoma rangeli SC58]